jgi:hypothetical protein
MAPDPDLASAMADLLVNLEPIREAVTGYRADLIRQEFSADTADMMAMDFHRVLMGMLESSLRKAG